MKLKVSLILFFILCSSFALQARVKYSCKACCGKDFISVSEYKGFRLQSKLVIWLNSSFKDNGFRIYRYQYSGNGQVNKSIFIQNEAQFTYVIKQKFFTSLVFNKLDLVEIARLVKATEKCHKLKMPEIFNTQFLSTGFGWFPYKMEGLD